MQPAPPATTRDARHSDRGGTPAPATRRQRPLRPQARMIRSIAVRATSVSSRRPFAPTRTCVPGQTYTADTLDQALHDLYATQLFADATITGTETGNLVINVRENPVINRITFEGNKHLKAGQDHAGNQAFAAPDLHPFGGPVGRRPDPRSLPPPRPLRRASRAEDRPARPEPRRRGVRNYRRRPRQGPRDQHHRQQDVSGRPPAQGNVHQAGGRVRSASSSPTTPTTPTGLPPTSRSCAPST